MTTSVEGRFQKESELRLREMPEWDAVLVFTPRRPDLHILNTTSWAIMELCRGQSFEELRREYRELVSGAISPEDADQHLVGALKNLQRKGIVHQGAGPSTTGRKEVTP